MTSEYYGQVADYFDEAAADFEARYWANPTLQRIRQSFREEAKRCPFRIALEVGCGPGIDLAHFGRIYPDRAFVGLDVSPRMLDLARARCAQLENVRVEYGSAEDAARVLGPGAFDLGYVFFGALNTVECLDRAAEGLYDALAPGGRLVVTVVNRFYLADVALDLLKGRIREAFSRLRGTWGGYAPGRQLTCRCLSPSEVNGAFAGGGDLIARRGFSITYPAWYHPRLSRALGRAGSRLWELDRWLSRTPAWSWGEYALYVYRKRPKSNCVGPWH
jgi:SAM-dependent methyltransferase